MMLYAYSMNFETFAKTLASDDRTDFMGIREVSDLWEVLRPTYAPKMTIPTHSDPKVNVIVADAWDDPVLADSMKNRRKIEGIKRIRELYTNRDPGSLKTAKDAYEFIEYQRALIALREKLVG